jgi:hypothetical protein
MYVQLILVQKTIEAGTSCPNAGIHALGLSAACLSQHYKLLARTRERNVA